jgi:hypothetical protein
MNFKGIYNKLLSEAINIDPIFEYVDDDRLLLENPDDLYNVSKSHCFLFHEDFYAADIDKGADGKITHGDMMQELEAYYINNDPVTIEMVFGGNMSSELESFFERSYAGEIKLTRDNFLNEVPFSVMGRINLDEKIISFWNSTDSFNRENITQTLWLISTVYEENPEKYKYEIADSNNPMQDSILLSYDEFNVIDSNEDKITKRKKIKTDHIVHLLDPSIKGRTMKQKGIKPMKKGLGAEMRFAMGENRNLFDDYIVSLISEETFENLFRNPKHNEKKMKDILELFEQSGGTILGSGAFATTLSHPKWNYILKIFHNDSAYLAYARYAFKNQHNPCVPKFLDKPRKIIPNYSRDWLYNKNLYYVRMEKLKSLQEMDVRFYDMYKTINRRKTHLLSILSNNDIRTKEEFLQLDLLNPSYTSDQILAIEDIQKLLKTNPWIFDYINVLKDVHALANSISATIDLHDENVMVRSDGVLVITDPLSFRKDLNPSKEEVEEEARKYFYNMKKHPDHLLKIKGGRKGSKNKIIQRMRKEQKIIWKPAKRP